jgi:hypothetical protein
VYGREPPAHEAFIFSVWALSSVAWPAGKLGKLKLALMDDEIVLVVPGT